MTGKRNHGWGYRHFLLQPAHRGPAPAASQEARTQV